MHQIAYDVGQQLVQQEGGRAGQLAAAQVFLGDPRRQRVGPVELTEGFDQVVAHGFEPGAVHVPGLRLRHDNYRGAGGRGGNGGLQHPGARH